MFTPEQLRVLSIGYDLDCGGYEFERAPKALDPDGEDVVIFDDPDLDYLGLQDVVRMGDYSCGLFAFAPGDEDFEFPESYEEDDLGTMVRVAKGVLYGSDHECHCHGKLVTWTGAAGEPREALSGEKVAEFIRAGVEVEDPPNFPRRRSHGFSRGVPSSKPLLSASSRRRTSRPPVLTTSWVSASERSSCGGMTGCFWQSFVSTPGVTCSGSTTSST